MIAFVKRHWISLGLLVICTFVGVFSLIRQSPIDIWRIDYEFALENQSKLPEIARADTVFQFDGIVCRNYTGSISDTLVAAGIKRHEMQVYLPRPSKERAIRIGFEVFPTEHITINNQRFRETQRTKRDLLSWILVGLFLGMIAEFLLALKKNPSTR